MNRIIEILAGIAIIIITILFLFHAYEKSDQIHETKGQYKLLANFDNIGGLKQGTEVMLSGVKIGNITHVELDYHYQYLAKVEISIIDEVKVPEDSTLQVASSNLLGDKHLKIIRGYSQTMLEEGKFFENTQSAVDIEDIIKKLISGFSDKNKSEYFNDKNLETKNYQEHFVDDSQEAKTIS